MSTSACPEQARPPRPVIAPGVTSSAAVATSRVLPRSFVYVVGGLLASVVAAVVYQVSASVVAMLVTCVLVAAGFGLSAESMAGWMARTAQRRRDEAGERR